MYDNIIIPQVIVHRAFIDLLSDDEPDNDDLFIQQSIEASLVDW